MIGLLVSLVVLSVSLVVFGIFRLVELGKTIAQRLHRIDERLAVQALGAPTRSAETIAFAMATPQRGLGAPLFDARSPSQPPYFGATPFSNERQAANTYHRLGITAHPSLPPPFTVWKEDL